MVGTECAGAGVGVACVGDVASTEVARSAPRLMGARCVGLVDAFIDVREEL